MKTMTMGDWRGARAAALIAGGLALFAAWPTVAAAQDRAAGERVIRVSGIGEVTVEPDEATITFAVETFASSAREAGEENARVMDRVMAALERAGVDRDDMETQSYSVYPEYIHEQGMDEPRIRGYRATNRVVLTTTDLDRVGELIDVALGAGANRMDGVSFTVRDADAAMAAAITQAVTRARASAQAMASALGVGLGPVLEASTTSAASPPVPVMARMEMAQDAASTPIRPGEQTVHATVTVTFGIDG